MAYNPKTGLIDPFNGMEDIKYKKIRCVGSAEDRFNEDALRILRAIRFEAQLGFVGLPDHISLLHEPYDRIHHMRDMDYFVENQSSLLALG